jgi:hypothetical protein
LAAVLQRQLCSHEGMHLSFSQTSCPCQYQRGKPPLDRRHFPGPEAQGRMLGLETKRHRMEALDLDHWLLFFNDNYVHMKVCIYPFLKPHVFTTPGMPISKRETSSRSTSLSGARGAGEDARSRDKDGSLAAVLQRQLCSHEGMHLSFSQTSCLY